MVLGLAFSFKVLFSPQVLWKVIGACILTLYPASWLEPILRVFCFVLLTQIGMPSAECFYETPAKKNGNNWSKLETSGYPERKGLHSCVKMFRAQWCLTFSLVNFIHVPHTYGCINVCAGFYIGVYISFSSFKKKVMRVNAACWNCFLIHPSLSHLPASDLDMISAS